MAKILRKIAKIFGSSAGVNEIAEFGSLAQGTPAFSTDPADIQSLASWLSGWFGGVEAGNSPAIEDMNGFCYVMSYQVAYLMQQGIAEWNSATTYFIGSLVNSAGDIYKSLTDNNLNNALSDTTKWKSILTSPITSLCLSNWVSQSQPSVETWQSVATDGSVIVAVCSSSTTYSSMYSYDGVAWVGDSGLASQSWQSVCYGNGKFVAVSSTGANRAATSTDGITWTSRTAVGTNSWLSVCYGNNLFVAVGGGASDYVMTSPDGITWTSRTAAGSAATWQSVCYGNGLFVAVNSNGTGTARVMTSPDGITWTIRTAVAAVQWFSVTYGNGLYVAVAKDNTTNVMTSPDGITWTDRSSSLTASTQYEGVTYGNGVFVAVTSIYFSNNASYALSSYDGITWTRRSALVGNWRDVCWASGVRAFVAVGNGTSTPGIMNTLFAPE